MYALNSSASRVVRRLLAGSFLLTGLCFATPARAQADATATRKASIDVYAGVTYLYPKFGPDKDTGYIAGGDFTVHFRLVDTALDLRYTSANGTYADESSFLGGLKFSRPIGKFHPYVNVLLGHGNIKFDHPELLGDPTYTHDDSTVYGGGVGLDYDLTRRFGLKLDAQAQHWDLGKETKPFYPYNASLGLIYHIPFRYLRGSRY